MKNNEIDIYTSVGGSVPWVVIMGYNDPGCKYIKKTPAKKNKRKTPPTTPETIEDPPNNRRKMATPTPVDHTGTPYASQPTVTTHQQPVGIYSQGNYTPIPGMYQQYPQHPPYTPQQYPPMTNLPTSPDVNKPPPWVADLFKEISVLKSQTSKIDLVTSELSDIKAHLLKLDGRMYEMERIKTTVTDLEKSMGFMNARFEEWRHDRTVIDHRLTEFKTTIEKAEITNIRYEEQKLRETMIDVQIRSMSCNLLFMGIPEQPSTSTDPENTTEKVNVIIDMLELPDDIPVEKSHRLGAPRCNSTKPRPIIARFRNAQTADDVRHTSYKKLTSKEYRIAEQLPEEVRAYRQQVLYGPMKKAKDEGKKSHMVKDRLYIDGKHVRVEPPPPYRALTYPTSNTCTTALKTVVTMDTQQATNNA